MRRKSLELILGGLLALALCFSLSAERKVMTKDLRIKGHVEGDIVAVNGTTLVYSLVDIGETAHAGRHYNTFTSLVPAVGAIQSEGIWVGANGDKLSWTGIMSGSTLDVTVIGGTGRYTGASGGFTGTVTNMEIDPVTGHISYDYTGEGAVTY